MVLDALSDNVLQILILAAAISLAIGIWEDPHQGWMEGAAILLAVVIVVSVTTTNEYFKQKQFIKLNASADYVDIAVVRGGKEMEVPAEDIVVGDIVYLKAGDILQVDGVLFRGHGIKADESSITGESELIHKQPPGEGTASPFLLSGSKISEGTGQMVVCAVGAKSLLGKSKEMLEEEEEEATPLQGKLEAIAEDIGKIGMAAGFLTFLALMVYLAINTIERGTWDRTSWKALIDSFIIMVTIVVVAVPEGLPLAVTLSLAYAVGQMKDENNFVRHLQACETMGGANNICSDKTGTLTENKMTAVRVFAQGQDYTRESVSELSPAIKQALYANICCNSTAFLSVSDSGKEVQSGSRTECALLSLAMLSGYDYRLIRTPERELLQVPFTSESKKMTTVTAAGDQVKVWTKGASEVVLGLCTYVLRGDGHIAPLEESERQTLLKEIKCYSSESLRTISFAYKDLQQSKSAQSPKELETNLVFIGFIGIEDPIRPEVPEAVLKAQKAGVVVRMVTGDGIETAIKIAKQCHLLPAEYDYKPSDLHIMEGRGFREYVGGLVSDIDEDGKATGHRVGNLEAFKEVAMRLRVLARSTPEDKFLLVTGLKELGNVVAVTGDGTNDAPALRKSDVGLAMNLSGTPLAKEAADIILIDDNFASIITAIKWGRNIYDCIRKFLQFQLTVNLVALFMSFLGAVVVKESPLTAVQMLWVNLIMDTLAALALATEKPSDSQLNRQPHSRSEYIITADMWRTILTMAVYQIAWLIVILFAGSRLFGVESSWGHAHWNLTNGKHFTLFFHIFVFLQLFNEINCRKLHSSELNVFDGFFTNWIFLGILIGTMIVQILLVQFGG
jgi:Ca2+ transporting ATPase